MEIKPIFYQIDEIYRQWRLTTKKVHPYDYLIQNYPVEYTVVVKKNVVQPSAKWRKAVKTYLEEQAKIDEWNKGKYIKL